MVDTEQVQGSAPDDVPPPPPGFHIEAAGDDNDVPPPPPGFKLETPKTDEDYYQEYQHEHPDEAAKAHPQPHDFTQEAVSGKLAPPAGGEPPPFMQTPEQRIAKGHYYTMPRTGQRVAAPYEGEDQGFAFGTDAPVQGATHIAGGIGDIQESEKNAIVTGYSMPGQKQVIPLQPGEQVPPGGIPYRELPEQRRRQAIGGMAETIQGTGEVGSVMVPAAVTAKPVATLASIGGGMAASETGGYIAKKAGASPETQELTKQVAFFVPSALGVLSGVKSASVETPEGRFSAASAFGGRVRGGVASTPEAIDVRGQVGGTTVGVRIPRPGAPEAPPPEPSEAAKALADFEQHSGNPDFQPAPAPAAPPGANGPEHLTPEVVKGVSEAIQKSPEGQRPQLMVEAHGNMVKWMMTRGTFTGPDGKVHTVDNQSQAAKLATKFINDEIDRVDRERQATAPAVPPETQRELDTLARTPAKTANAKPEKFKEGDSVPAMLTPQMVDEYDEAGFRINAQGRLERKTPPPAPPVTEEHPELAAQADRARQNPDVRRFLERPRASEQTADIVHESGPDGSMGAGMTRNAASVRAVEQHATLVPGQEPDVQVKKESASNAARLAQPPRPVKPEDLAMVGQTDSDSGRQIVQPTDSKLQNERLAAEAAPELATHLSRIAAEVPGAKFDRLRPQKNWNRLNQKEDDGKPPETVQDYLAAQIAADTPQAKDALLEKLRNAPGLRVLSVEDKFLEPREDLAGYSSTNVQVQLSNGASAELQIVPREVQEVTDQSHHFYTKGRKAKDRGDTAEAERNFKEAARITGEALDRFKQRNGIAESEDDVPPPPAGFTVEPEHEFASTQINVGPNTALGRAHRAAVAAIPEEHLGKEGRETTPHVTVRYGLRDDSADAVARIRRAVAHIQPFEVPVGKTHIFPATEHSSFDHPVIAKLETTPELKALREAVESAGGFKKDNFPEYKPHITLAYVKPEFAQQYKGGNHLEGQKVLVDHISISKRNRKQDIILLGRGQPAAEPGSNRYMTPSAIKISSLRSDLVQARASGNDALVREIQAAIDKEQHLANGGRPDDKANEEQYQRARRFASEAGMVDASERGGMKAFQGDAGKLVSFEHPQVGHWVNLGGGERKFAPATITRKPTDIQSVSDVLRIVEAKANELRIPVPQDVQNMLASAPARVADAFTKLFAEPAEGEQTVHGGRNEATPSRERAGVPQGLSEIQSRGEATRDIHSVEVGRAGPGGSTHNTTAAKTGELAGESGDDTQIKLATGENLSARYKLVEAEDITPSHHPTRFSINKSYPEGVQERQYHRDRRAQSRIVRMTQDFDPEIVLSDDPTPVNGPPVVTPDGIALGGNSRAMTIQRRYAFGEEPEYIDMLKRRLDRFGIDPAAVDRFTHPMLVRELAAQPKDPEDARRIGSLLNKVPTASLSSSERAVSAGKRISDDTRAAISRMALDLGADATLKDVIGRHGRQIVSMLAQDGAITEKELPQYTDTASPNGVSPEGQQLIERAMRGNLVDDPELMERIPKSVLNKLDTSLADISILGARHDGYNIIPVLRQALAQHAELSERGLTVEDYLGQSGLFGGVDKNPAVDALVRTLGEKPTAVRKAIHQFTVDANLDQPGQGLIGMSEAPTPVDAFNAAFGSQITPEQLGEATGSKGANGAKAHYRMVLGSPGGTGATEPTPSNPVARRAEQKSAFTKELAGISGGLKDITTRAINLLAPRIGVPSSSLDAVMRMKGKREEDLYKLVKANEGVTRFFNRLPEAERIAYVDRMKRGERQPTPELQQIAEMHRAVLDHFRRQEKLYKPHLEDRANYFPVRWKVVPGTEKQNVSGFFRRPLSGPKTFTKRQSLPDMSSGIERGGIPVTTNPQTMVENRVAESLTFTTAQQLFRDLEQMGAAQKVRLGGDAPDGFVRISDPMGQLYLNPNLPVTEYFDEQIWDGLNDFAQSLGIKHVRSLRIGTPAMGVSQGNVVKTKTGTSLDTLMHEIGHQIQDKYGFIDKIVRDRRFANELRALAELRYEGKEISDAQKKYVHSKDEKAATVIEALLFARERFQQVAPRVYDWVTTYLKNTPALRPLLDIRPGLVSGSRTDELFAGGPVIGGNWYFEPNTARLLENFLSRDRIRESPFGRGFVHAKNATTAWRLSFSPFHAITETGLATGSEFGRGLEHIWNQGIRQGSMKDIGRGLAIFAKAPASAITAAREGGSMIRNIASRSEIPPPQQFASASDFLNSSRAKDFLKKYPEAAELVTDLFTGGAKLALHEDFRVNALQGFERALADHRYLGALFRSPGTVAQAVQYPLFELFIPRLKVGMWLREYSEALADRADDVDAGRITREKLARQTWDSIDHRFGEMNWDDFFWNRTFKTALQLAFRAAAWTIGNFRFVGSAFTGQSREFWESAKFIAGNEDVNQSTTAIPKLDPRMGKLLGMTILMVVVNTVLHYLLTHRYPKDMRDLVAPEDGTLDKDGRPNRVLIPFVPFTDAISLAHSPMSYAKNKVADIWTAIPEAIRNRDFRGDLISHPDDAYWKQMFDRASHVVGTPIGIERYRQARDRGESRGHALGESLGAKSAPKEWDMSPAERLARELASNHPDYRSSLSDEQLESVEQRRALEQAREQAGEMAHVPQLERDFKYLSLMDARKVMEKANQQERDRLWSMYQKKRSAALQKALRERGRTGRPVTEQIYEDLPR